MCSRRRRSLRRKSTQGPKEKKLKKTDTHIDLHTSSGNTKCNVLATQAQLKQRQTAKRLYVGNLPIGLTGVEALLAEFFNQTMIAAVCVCVCVCVCARAREHLRARMHACMRACMHACVRA